MSYKCNLLCNGFLFYDYFFKIGVDPLLNFIHFYMKVLPYCVIFKVYQKNKVIKLIFFFSISISM